ncbi:hypothetical protein [Nocardiopsis halophila]|uniref:hypothetical protein n=1 Tax=Nocardiopsis halophila TaxID=141692 RepID=UPI0003488BAD|nr:hypothetical protein [Nocardiopsis halophila]
MDDDRAAHPPEDRPAPRKQQNHGSHNDGNLIQAGDIYGDVYLAPPKARRTPRRRLVTAIVIGLALLTASTAAALTAVRLAPRLHWSGEGTTADAGPAGPSGEAEPSPAPSAGADASADASPEASPDQADEGEPSAELPPDAMENTTAAAGEVDASITACSSPRTIGHVDWWTCIRDADTHLEHFVRLENGGDGAIELKARLERHNAGDGFTDCPDGWSADAGLPLTVPAGTPVETAAGCTSQKAAYAFQTLAQVALPDAVWGYRGMSPTLHLNDEGKTTFGARAVAGRPHPVARPPHGRGVGDHR